MKKVIMQASLMTVGVLVLAIGAFAQGAPQYRANIPFDFEANGKQNPAGAYSIGILSLTSQGALAITNRKDGRSVMLGITSRPGTSQWDKPGKLVFYKTNGVYQLAEVSTPSFEMKVKRTRTSVREVAGGSSPSGELVTVHLN